MFTPFKRKEEKRKKGEKNSPLIVILFQ